MNSSQLQGDPYQYQLITETFSFAKDWFSKRLEPILANKTLEVSVKVSWFPTVREERGGGGLFVTFGHKKGKTEQL